jgi:sortase (surface protein transpeptidase)
LIEQGTGPAPVRISVSEIDIDGPVEAVGIAADLQLDVPFAQAAGWYRHSSTPETPGATVIAAHVDYGGQPGLFYNLRLATVGDLIHLELADGTHADYAVLSVVLYDKTELPADELFRSGGPHALHLVTCGGSFDRFAKSYRGNQVITALPVA